MPGSTDIAWIVAGRDKNLAMLMLATKYWRIKMKTFTMKTCAYSIVLPILGLLPVNSMRVVESAAWHIQKMLTQWVLLAIHWYQSVTYLIKVRLIEINQTVQFCFCYETLAVGSIHALWHTLKLESRSGTFTRKGKIIPHF